MRNISAVQRPMPRTSVSSSTISSSDRRATRSSSTSPASTFSARSRIDAVLFPDKPAARSVSTGSASTASGVGVAVEHGLEATVDRRGPPRRRAAGSRWPAPARRSGSGGDGPRRGRRARRRRRSAANRGSWRARAAAPFDDRTSRATRGTVPAAGRPLTRPVACLVPRRLAGLLACARRAHARARRVRWWRRRGHARQAGRRRPPRPRPPRRREQRVVHRHGEARRSPRSPCTTRPAPPSRRASSRTRGSTTPTCPVEGPAGVPGEGAAHRTGGCRCCSRCDPNGSTGWVKATTSPSPPTRSASRSSSAHAPHHRHASGTEVIYTGPVAIGATDPPLPDVGKPTPTPTGEYYLRILVQAPDPNTRLRARTPTGCRATPTSLDTFAGGDAEIGIHGNNDASVLGTDATHGCIRMDNDAITMLAKQLPLGTPVDVERLTRMTRHAASAASAAGRRSPARSRSRCRSGRRLGAAGDAGVAAAVGAARRSSPSSDQQMEPFGLRVTRAALVDAAAGAQSQGHAPRDLRRAHRRLHARGLHRRHASP